MIRISPYAIMLLVFVLSVVSGYVSAIGERRRRRAACDFVLALLENATTVPLTEDEEKALAEATTASFDADLAALEESLCAGGTVLGCAKCLTPYACGVPACRCGMPPMRVPPVGCKHRNFHEVHLLGLRYVICDNCDKVLCED